MVAAVVAVTVAFQVTPLVAVAVGVQAVLAHLQVQATSDMPQLTALSRQAVKAVVVPLHLAAARAAPHRRAVLVSGANRGPGVAVVVDGVLLEAKAGAAAATAPPEVPAALP